MKAQGLPINFIVIAALAILILVLAAGFVIAGSSSFSGAIGPETVKNTCQNYCSRLSAYTMNNVLSSSDLASSSAPTDYCSKTFVVKGVTDDTGETCGELESKLGFSCIMECST